MEFCPRCGRYLKDDEFQCPECGNIVRQRQAVPPTDMPGYMSNGRAEPIDLKKIVFEKYFFIALAVAFVMAFAVTYLWRFTFLFFCFPLILPFGRMSITAGVFAGVSLGSVTAILLKYFILNALIA